MKRTYMIKANLTVEHLYAVVAENDEEALNFINKKERYKGEEEGNIRVLDKAWIGTSVNKVENIEMVWEED